MTRGEVWWYEGANEKRRPVCILTRPEAIPRLSSLVVVSATRTRRGLPTEVEVDEADGMPTPSVLSLDNVRTVRKGLLTDRITRLSPARMDEVCQALARATGC